MSRGGKRKSARQHFRARVFQRLGVKLTRPEMRTIYEFVRDGEAQFVARSKSGTRILYGVCIKGRDCVVVYDKALKSIVTALRAEWFDREAWDSGSPAGFESAQPCSTHGASS